MAESYISSLTQLDEGKILADLNSIAIELGLITQVYQTSRIYVYYAVLARVFGNLTQTIAQYLNNLNYETTTDEALLDMMLKPFIAKKYAKVSKTILQFTRRNNEDDAVDIFIPRNFEVMTEGNDPIIFRTAESRILWKDAYSVKIPAYSVEFGSINNVPAGSLTYFNDAQYSVLSVTNPFPAYGGSEEETAFDTRNRLGAFRYARDGSIEHIQQLLFNNGVSYYSYNIVEFWDGFGSVLVVIDVASEDEYWDIIGAIETKKVGGIKYHYCKASYIWIDITVNVKVTGDRLYTEYQIDEVENQIQTAVELYFSNQIYVGKKLSKNRLEAYILQYLVDERFDVYEIEIDIANNFKLKKDPKTNQLLINEFERLMPNKVRTQIEYNFD